VSGSFEDLANTRYAVGLDLDMYVVAKANGTVFCIVRRFRSCIPDRLRRKDLSKKKDRTRRRDLVP
jgi:hypothetical protein